jgi:hypothetical protein
MSSDRCGLRISYGAENWLEFVRMKLNLIANGVYESVADFWKFYSMLMMKMAVIKGRRRWH